MVRYAAVFFFFFFFFFVCQGHALFRKIMSMEGVMGSANDLTPGPLVLNVVAV